MFRDYPHWRTLIVPLATLALALSACGGTEGETDTGAGESPTDPATEPLTETETTSPTETSSPGTAAEIPEDGPTITVGSFNFPESVILAEIYAQALEDAGYPIETELNLGARELIYTDLEAGNIDFLPEYVGSALAVGFGGEATADTEETRTRLQEAFNAFEVTVLEPAPAQDKNVFAVTQEFAQENDLQMVSDLETIEGDLTLGGPPECEERQTCFQGLKSQFDLPNLQFEAIQEQPVRVQALRNGQIDVALLFSTDPVLQQENLVALEEQELIPAENITPVVRNEIIEAYGEPFTTLVNSISQRIETQTLIDLNTQVSVEGADPADVAQAWLEENGFLEG